MANENQSSPQCPACNSPMKMRKGRFGAFWGCTNYPTCRRTIPVETVDAAAAGARAERTSPGAGNGAAQIEDAPEAAAPRQPRIAEISYEEASRNNEALQAKLDSAQRQVRDWKPYAKNLRVIAAAGSGKTTTTVALVSHLVRSAAVSAQNLVVTTFTSKAGIELVERLSLVLPPGALSSMRVGTFHGLALRALRGAGGWDMSHCMDIGRRAAGIPSSTQLWSKVLGYAGPDGVPGTAAEGLGLEEPDVKGYMLAVDVARSHALTGEKLEAALELAEREEGLPYLARAWRMVSDSKRALHSWDFADALQAWYELLLHSNPTDGLVVMVDEAQDNSELQLKIAQRLAEQGSLLLVGDCRQAIYSWRGAFPEFFRDADKLIGAETLELPSNYRSGSRIVETGNACAAGKAWSVGGAAVAKRDLEGEIAISGYQDPEDEAKAVAQAIQRRAHDGVTLDSIAILCRTNAASGAFEAALVEAEIPCVVVGGTPFFKRFEVMNALAYVKLSIADDMEAFARIVNKPRRYLGAKFVQAVQRRLQHAGSLPAAIDAATGELYRKQRDAAVDFYSFLVELRAAAWPASVDMIVKLLSPPESSAGEADADRSGIVAAVASLAKRFTSAEAFLAFAARCAGEVTEAKSADGGFEVPAGRVTISTIHKAKGLEWQHLFVSASNGVFPHRRSTTEARLAEEDRLFYVAVTRARDTLALSYSDVDVYGRPAGPSPFLAYAGWEGEEPDGGDDEPPHMGPHGGGLPFAEPETQEQAFSADAAANYLEQERAAGVAMQLQREVLIAAGAKPMPVDMLWELFGPRWAEAQAGAKASTLLEPAARQGEGGRYVEVELASFQALLEPLQFLPAPADVELKMHQKVFRRGIAAGDGTVWLSVYTTIPAGGDEARAVGEDSIKASLVYEDADGKTKPLAKKLPYACRTRGWREVLLSKIEELVSRLGPERSCPKCGAPMAERKAMRPDGEHAFLGCVRFPDCRASRNLDGAVTARS